MTGRRSILVIGAGPAGLSAARAALRADPRADVRVFEQRPSYGHAACRIPHLLDGRARSAADLIVANAVAGGPPVQVRAGAGIEAIDPIRAELVLAGGRRLAFDRLVVATGARPRRLEVPGEDLAGVFHLRWPADGERIRDRLTACRPVAALVAGAGLLGLELAEVLLGLGLAVTVVDAGREIAGGLAGTPAQAVRERLERAGGRLVAGVRIAAFEEGAGGLTAVHLADERVPAGLALVAIGVQPEVELARRAGLETGAGGALRTDRHCAASRLGVYAAGDCADVVQRVSGRRIYRPASPVAHRMGRTAGVNAGGGRAEFAGVTGTRLGRVFGLEVGRTGLSESELADLGRAVETVEIEAPVRMPPAGAESPLRVRLAGERGSGRLLAAAAAGEHGVAARIGLAAAALAARWSAAELAETDLGYAPDLVPIRDPLVIAARQLARRL